MEMSDRELKKEISKYAQDVAFGVLAYVRADLTPVQRTFGAFAIDGDDILFSTGKSTPKIGEIAGHPKVSFFLERRDQELRGWKSVLYIGTAAPLRRKGA
jgi:general stress protein 26